MTTVCLVSMPFAAVERPSMALGLLKAHLETRGLACRTIYANLDYAAFIGLERYLPLSHSFTETLLGEWIFSPAAFPEFKPDPEVFMGGLWRVNPNLAQALQTTLGSDFEAFLLKARQDASRFIEQTARQVMSHDPWLVGCSSMFQQNCASLALLRHLKRLAPSLITFMGGANCEGPLARATLECFPWVDYVCSGEADETFPGFCQALQEQGTRATPPPGILGRLSAAAEDAPRGKVRHLDDLPVPQYDDYFAALEGGLGAYLEPALLAETSRGCWWGEKHHCSFCGLNGAGMTFRSKSPARVVADFQTLRERYGPHPIEVVDNILDLAHLRDALPQLETWNPLPELFYETKANLRKRQLEQMSRAGVHWIQPGIESMHEQSLKALDKGTTPVINVQLLKWGRELGMHVIWNLLYGIPGEQDEWYAEMADWFELLFHLQPPGMNPIRYDRFSPYHQRPEAYGLRLVPNPRYAQIYPVPPEQLGGLAYFFIDLNDRAALQKSDRPGLRRLLEVVGRWQSNFAGESAATLSMVDQDEVLVITDTRPVARRELTRLTGLTRRLYLACDQARTLGQAAAEVGAEEAEVASELAALVESGLVLALDGRYLSLALLRPRHLFPKPLGGKVDMVRYLRDRIRGRIAGRSGELIANPG